MVEEGPDGRILSMVFRYGFSFIWSIQTYPEEYVQALNAALRGLETHGVISREGLSEVDYRFVPGDWVSINKGPDHFVAKATGERIKAVWSAPREGSSSIVLTRPEAIQLASALIRFRDAA